MALGPTPKISRLGLAKFFEKKGELYLPEARERRLTRVRQFATFDGRDAARAKRRSPIRTPESALSILRNQIAHGGGITRRAAARLIEVWKPRIDEMLELMAWLSRFRAVLFL